MDAKQKKRIGCGALVLLFLIGLTLMLVFLYFRSSGQQTSLSAFQEKALVVVRIENAIFNSEKAVKQLDACRKDDGVKAVVLRIDSPGGGVAACQEIYEAVKRLRESGRKVVASFGSVAASGGYYIACAADSIVSNPGSVTGSIGVIFEFPYLEELMKKVGVELEVVKSGSYKDAGGFHRKMSLEERRVFQSLIDDTWSQFMEVVSEGRHLSSDSVRKLADGRIYTGRQAKNAGLVDVMGTFEDAKILAGKMAGLPEDTAPFEFKAPGSMLRFLMGDVEERLQQKMGSFSPGLAYLFKG
ncbi:MAG: hypothetical protein A2293_07415 [Elusimicrobia bacterium RIFOXYB2_FULL_49_7]|nr:MAG: hypothetical protein A2293_07415 [Elusimicrobia bacterium RIFOXYB2_FULL_49_7]